jgi:hypothetical protein
MAREISRAEAWEKAHVVFSQVNFNAFDFNTIKESLLDYTKLYFPENFNDFIETSEYIAILELFAYVGELLAYRIDLNAHENFITTAQRKESILRIAKMLSYKVSRNIPLRGLVKITSVQTTESVFDSSNRNISGRKILWGDPNNLDWKEQFLLVMNKVLQQNFGSVTPNDRVQVDNTLMELYDVNHLQLSNDGKTVFPYLVTTNAGSYNMELVPIVLTESGPIEKRPEYNGNFSLLYASDGLGDNSDTTGFLALTKQGVLGRVVNNFDGVTSNQTYELNTKNINETDIWVNNINPDNNQIITYDPYAELLPHLATSQLRYGEWVEVDLAHSQNIIFNTNTYRRKYEVETLDEDKVRLVFGDGEFSDIPSGQFHIWYRTSANDNGTIPKNAIVDQKASFTYIDYLGNVQTFTFTFTLVNSLNNGSVSEDIEHIRRLAPSVYYTQDRMVNARDYNVFMLQDPSILRLRAINRTFSGDSKYIAWHDPKEYYENVKIFGDDLSLYWLEKEPNVGGIIIIPTPESANNIIINYLQPLLYTTDIFSIISPKLQQYGLNFKDVRKQFNDTPYYYDPIDPTNNELVAINAALINASLTVDVVYMYYSIIYDEWTVGQHPLDFLPTDPLSSWSGAEQDWPGYIHNGGRGLAESILIFQVSANFIGSVFSGWDVRWKTKRLIAHSPSTKFWHINKHDKQINYNTMNALNDKLIILQANPDATKMSLLTENKEFSILNQESVEQNLPTAGLPDIHRISVLYSDKNGDGVSDDMALSSLLNITISKTWDMYEKFYDTIDGDCLLLPNGLTYNNSLGIDYDGKQEGLDADIEVYVNGIKQTFSSGQLSVPSNLTNDLIVNSVYIQNITNDDVVTLIIYDYVYFYRESYVEEWLPVPNTDTIRTMYMLESSTNIERKTKRHNGRYNLNFAWFHVASRYHLIDPAPSNIIDIFMITKGYFIDMRRWLEGNLQFRPEEPSSLQLRNTYSKLLQNKMISDTVILHSGKFKILFGSKAQPELRCKFNVIRQQNTSLTDNQVKNKIVDIIRRFFDFDMWEFGETFYFTELSTVIHYELGTEIESIVLVPLYPTTQFGDMFIINTTEEEMFIPDISVSDIEMVDSFTLDNIRQ